MTLPDRSRRMGGTGPFQSGANRSGREQPDPDQIEDVMIKDPVCQVYFPRKEGVQWRQGGETYYFCSPECLEAFKQNRQQPPNGAR